MKKEFRESSDITIAMAQMNMTLGDIQGNLQKVIDLSIKARDELHADIIVFPELTLTGYPPEDLLYRSKLHQQVEKALQTLCQQVKDIYIVLGHPAQAEKLYNAASVIFNKKIIAQYHKQLLPNYSVFDEKRYFAKGQTWCVFTVKNRTIGILICEDLWHEGPVEQVAQAGAEVILSLNASPFHRNKPSHRIEVIRKRIQEANLPVVYVNCVSGQDELIFDGGSFALKENGDVIAQMLVYEECLATVRWSQNNQWHSDQHADLPSEIEGIYQALVLGTRDYLIKNKMPGAIIGLSGGIDSALTLCIAVDAIGAENVLAVMLPFRHTSQISIEDARALAKQLKVNYQEISIESMFEAYQQALLPLFPNLNAFTQENLQARCRGTLLMALSNQIGKMVLNTSNKSEMAVGYATLYGDMVGGYAVLKDVLKTLVYQLAHWRNQKETVIPTRILTRAPSAELAPNQRDQDTLPPYEILDAIISLYIEQDASIEDIVAKGFDTAVVKDVLRRIEKAEYKRRQSPPGIRITQRAFGRDRRYPISAHFDSTQMD